MEAQFRSYCTEVIRPNSKLTWLLLQRTWYSWIRAS